MVIVALDEYDVQVAYAVVLCRQPTRGLGGCLSFLGVRRTKDREATSRTDRDNRTTDDRDNRTTQGRDNRTIDDRDSRTADDRDNRATQHRTGTREESGRAGQESTRGRCQGAEREGEHGGVSAARGQPRGSGARRHCGCGGRVGRTVRTCDRHAGDAEAVVRAGAAGEAVVRAGAPPKPPHTRTEERTASGSGGSYILSFSLFRLSFLYLFLSSYLLSLVRSLSPSMLSYPHCIMVTH